MVLRGGSLVMAAWSCQVENVELQFLRVYSSVFPLAKTNQNKIMRPLFPVNMLSSKSEATFLVRHQVNREGTFFKHFFRLFCGHFFRLF